MKKRMSFGLPALLLAAALILASCGSSGGGTQETAGAGGDAQETSEETTGEMASMNHGSMEMGSGETAPKELIVDGEYSDERFIGMMAAHHQTAIEMAKVAQQEAQLPEIRRIADDVVSTQQAEIDELRAIKEEAFGSSEVPLMMSSEEPSMYAMQMPDQLAGQEPFDRAFIDSMIPHHASAIEMASTANMRSNNPKIKRLARGITDAQSREIGEMIELRQQNYPEG
ncbi:MAG TPA: DUF305 domain-containing protein [Rubrobacteraceae bacterium]|nr:DUF305 domain-containing protein [Rubrobacteraceae bacterium]